MFSIKRKTIFHMLQRHPNKSWAALCLQVSTAIEKKLKVVDSVERKKVRNSVKRECSKIHQKWLTLGRANKTFFAKNMSWLLSEIHFGCPKKSRKSAGIYIALSVVYRLP